jgi:F0F1-type ATP synthase assembly protein I
MRLLSQAPQMCKNSRVEPDTPQPPSPKQQGPLYQGLKYTHIAFALPFGVIAGWLLGSLLDRWLGTTKLNLVGIGLGIIAGFYDLIRAYRALSRETDGGGDGK